MLIQMFMQGMQMIEQQRVGLDKEISAFQVSCRVASVHQHAH